MKKTKKTSTDKDTIYGLKSCIRSMHEQLEGAFEIILECSRQNMRGYLIDRCNDWLDVNEDYAEIKPEPDEDDDQ